MFWLGSNLRRDFRSWDRPTKVAIGLGLVLLLAAIVVIIAGPEDIRTEALLGAGALILVMQLAVLWGNRGKTTTYTRAQRLYLSGDFEGARSLLEDARAHGRADARLLTLLGNTYRQLGDLDRSETILSEALDKAPDHHFPLYGFGRTLLSQGAYADAAAMIRRAADYGAPPVVLADLGEAYYRLGSYEDARAALELAVDQPQTQQAPHRKLMVIYLLHALGKSEMPDRDLIQNGLGYWQASAQRYAHTPYGVDLASDVRALESLI